MPVSVALNALDINLDLQPRANGLDQQHADDMVAALRASPDADLPPVRVFRDPAGPMRLTRGFHRAEAYRRAGRTHIPADVRDGDMKAAALDAAGSGPEHTALKFTNEDKRRAVTLALTHAPEWTDRRIADFCGVSHPLVASVRGSLDPEVETDSTSPPLAKQGKGGKTYTAKPKHKTAPEPVSPPPPPAPKPEPVPPPPPPAAAPDGGRTHPSANASDVHEATDVQVETPADEPARPTKVLLPPARDAWGIPVQDHAAEAFAAIPKFKELLRMLRAVQGELTELVESPGGHLLLRRCQFRKSDNKHGGRWVLADLDNAIGQIEDATPAHTDCPYHFNTFQPHDGDGRPCPLCNNRRVTGNLKRFQVPPELLEAMRTHYGVTEESA